jgi:hypothetical protein
MSTSTRPETPAERAAARRNLIIFSLGSVFVVTAIVAVITLLLV